jgi:hypothetical protein
MSNDTCVVCNGFNKGEYAEVYIGKKIDETWRLDGAFKETRTQYAIKGPYQYFVCDRCISYKPKILKELKTPSLKISSIKEHWIRNYVQKSGMKLIKNIVGDVFVFLMIVGAVLAHAWLFMLCFYQYNIFHWIPMNAWAWLLGIVVFFGAIAAMGAWFFIAGLLLATLLLIANALLSLVPGIGGKIRQHDRRNAIYSAMLARGQLNKGDNILSKAQYDKMDKSW